MVESTQERQTDTRENPSKGSQVVRYSIKIHDPILRNGIFTNIYNKLFIYISKLFFT